MTEPFCFCEKMKKSMQHFASRAAGIAARRRPAQGSLYEGLHEVGDAVSRRVGAADAGRVRAVFEGWDFRTQETWCKAVLELWRGAKYREERYVAIALCGDKRAAAYQTLAAMPIYEEMIVTGAWWDYVDTLSGVGGRRDSAEIPGGDAEENTPVERFAEYVEAADVNHLPVEVQERHEPARCCMRASSRRWSRRNFSCEKRSAGRCGNMRGPIRRKSGVTCERMGPAERTEPEALEEIYVIFTVGLECLSEAAALTGPRSR